MKVLSALPNYSSLCQEAIELLEKNGCEVICNQLGRPMGFEDLKDLVADIDGAIVGVDEWDASLLDLAPNLKVLARFGVGVDNINLKECASRGVVVCNSPGVNSNSVAEHAVMLILCSLRHVGMCDRACRKGTWPRVMHHELKGKTVGLLGFGAVGRRVAQLLEPFHVELVAYDKFPNAEQARELGVTMLSQEEVIRRADILSLHLPATPETHHTICKETLEMMKEGACLINTARGPVVDEQAICSALESGKLCGYAADVFEHEPPTADMPLFQYENYLCTPHVAAESYESWRQTGLVTAQAVLDVFSGRKPQNRLA